VSERSRDPRSVASGPQHSEARTRSAGQPRGTQIPDVPRPRPLPRPPYIVHIHTHIDCSPRPMSWVGPLLSLGSRLCLFRLFRMDVTSARSLYCPEMCALERKNGVSIAVCARVSRALDRVPFAPCPWGGSTCGHLEHTFHWSFVVKFHLESAVGNRTAHAQGRTIGIGCGLESPSPGGIGLWSCGKHACIGAPGRASYYIRHHTCASSRRRLQPRHVPLYKTPRPGGPHTPDETLQPLFRTSDTSRSATERTHSVHGPRAGACCVAHESACQ